MHRLVEAKSPQAFDILFGYGGHVRCFRQDSLDQASDQRIPKRGVVHVEPMTNDKGRLVEFLGDLVS